MLVPQLSTVEASKRGVANAMMMSQMGPSQGESGETWCIEDYYEGSHHYAKRPDPGDVPFAKIRLPFRPAAKPRWPTISDVPGDDSIKNILLKQGRRPSADQQCFLPPRSGREITLVLPVTATVEDPPSLSFSENPGRILMYRHHLTSTMCWNSPRRVRT